MKSAVVLILSLSVVACFRDGDFIQAARKAQFHEQRTQWHDLLGHHCPRFGRDRLVAIPLPKPILPLQLLDEYKLQLSFDGDRQLTPWLTIMGKGAPSVPVVEVVLRSSGSELLGVTASVATAPVAYQHKHMQLVQEFRNASHWPKHLLVRYHFETHNEVDLNRGLAVLFIAGLFSFLILAVTAVAGSSDKVAAFLAEVTAEDSMAVGRSSARGSMAKAE